MSVFIRYLLSLVVHMAWSRGGQRGPIPPMRVPMGKGRKAPLPTLAPWQMMAATWLLRKLWSSYGDHVKHHLTAAAHPIARRVGGLLPNPSASGAQPAPAPAAPNPAPPAPAQPAQSARKYNTQHLPTGSVLSGLRQPQPANPPQHAGS